HFGAVAARLHPAPDHRLALAADMARSPDRIALRGVDHPPAGFVEPVEHGEARVFVGRPAEHVTAQDQRDPGYRGVIGHANFSRIASRAMAASAAPAPLSSCAGSARTTACASFSTVRMPLPTARPSIVRAMIPRADS